jgi:hypothetical protein
MSFVECLVSCFDHLFYKILFITVRGYWATSWSYARDQMLPTFDFISNYIASISSTCRSVLGTILILSLKYIISYSPTYTTHSMIFPTYLSFKILMWFKCISKNIHCSKIYCVLVKRYEKYGRNPSWIVKRYGKWGRKVGWILKWYGKYGRKVGWIEKNIGQYFSVIRNKH